MLNATRGTQNDGKQLYKNGLCKNGCGKCFSHPSPNPPCFSSSRFINSSMRLFVFVCVSWVLLRLLLPYTCLLCSVHQCRIMPFPAPSCPVPPCAFAEGPRLHVATPAAASTRAAAATTTTTTTLRMMLTTMTTRTMAMMKMMMMNAERGWPAGEGR